MLGADPPPRLETPQDWRTPHPKIGEPPFPLPKNGEPPTKIGEAPPRMENPPRMETPQNFFFDFFFGHMVNAWAVRILLECILVIIYFYIARLPPDKTPLLRETDFGCITKAILPQPHEPC